METLDIEKFNPTKAEITKIVALYKDLTIQGVEDKSGYAKVDEARKELKKIRVNIEKTGKTLRSEAVAFQKAVIEKEKELVEMVEPTERELEAKQDQIDLEKEKLKRAELLPERQEKLKALSVSVDDEFLLLMDDSQFDGFYNQKNAEFLAEKERKIKEDQEKIEVEKKKLQDEKEAKDREEKHKADIERVRKETEEKTKLEAEQSAKRELERKEKIEADRIANEKSIQDKLEKDKKYQAFLKKNDYKQGEEFIVQHNQNKVLLYKKIDEINL